MKCRRVRTTSWLGIALSLGLVLTSCSDTTARGDGSFVETPEPATQAIPPIVRRGGTAVDGEEIPESESQDTATQEMDAVESDADIAQESAEADTGLTVSDTTEESDATEQPLCSPEETYCASSQSCCQAEETCWSYGCQKPGTPCSTDGDCSGDTYCDEESGSCIPWGTGPKGTLDLSCSKTPSPGVFFPKLQCEWQGPPEGDAYPEHRSVLGSVVSGKLLSSNGGASGASGSIGGAVQLAFISYAGTDGGLPSASCCGVIRVIDGSTCTQLATLSETKVVGGSNLALGDLNQDGLPEIVALAEGGGVVAYYYEPEFQAFLQLWKSTTPDGSPDSYPGSTTYQWAGPSIADVLGDSRPEILVDGAIYSADGVRLTNGPGWSGYQQGLFPVIADADLDGTLEIFFGARPYRVGEDEASLIPVPVDNAADLGHVALADLGDFPGSGGLLASQAAEIVVVGGGDVRAFDMTGQLVWGPVAIPGGGNGGPPTVADFDGDGTPEIAAAGATAYTVLDPECTGDPLPEGCESEFVLWSQPSQDSSSNKTGSSVFDFEGDGSAEAVYGDECFLRVYNGESGEVLFSGPRSSCTWHEMPIIADVDGDFRTEVVIGSNLNCNVSCPTLDPIFEGLRCDEGEQCGSGLCTGGRCRCSSDEECPDGYQCAPMVADDGEGSVCRAAHLGKKQGIHVYADAKDSWVYSRPIWNQHAYSVTNINDDGSVPPREELVSNWLVEGFNHFRQNAQGQAGPVLAADITVKFVGEVECAESTLEWTLEVCNRGALPVAPGIEVQVEAGEDVVSATTTIELAPSACEVLVGSLPWDGESKDPLSATVDTADGGEVFECNEENNTSQVLQNPCEL